MIAAVELKVHAFEHFQQGSINHHQTAPKDGLVSESLTKSTFISVVGKNFEKNSKKHSTCFILFQTWFNHFEQIAMKNIKLTGN